MDDHLEITENITIPNQSYEDFQMSAQNTGHLNFKLKDFVINNTTLSHRKNSPSGDSDGSI